MIERDMEDLIANYAADFFPRQHLVLIGRQMSFAGVGRFDLLFKDEHDSTILMELKARTLKYEDATQVAKYRDELKRNGCKNIVMWLIAPQIPSSVREFLDDKGIEYSELHFPEFRRIAERREFVIKSETENRTSEPPVLNTPTVRGSAHKSGRAVRVSSSVPTGPEVTAHSTLRWRAHGYDFVLENPENFNSAKFGSLLDSFAVAVRSGKNKSLLNDLRAWAANFEELAACFGHR